MFNAFGSTLGMVHFTVSMLFVFNDSGGEKNTPKAKINTTRTIQKMDSIGNQLFLSENKLIISHINSDHSRAWQFFTQDTFATIYNWFCNPNTVLGQNPLEIAGGKKCNQGKQRENLNFYFLFDLNLHKENNSQTVLLENSTM